MPAKKGNTYAEKWTKAEVLKALKQIQAEAQRPTCTWLGTALVRVGLYREIWTYWKEKFAKDIEVFQTIKNIDTIFEERLFSKALRGEANATVAIFGLKNNHGWKDRQEVDHTTAGESLNRIEIIISNPARPVTSEDDIAEDIG